MGRSARARDASTTSPRARALCGLLLGFLAGCSAPPSPRPPSIARGQSAPVVSSDSGELFSFPDATASPRGVANVPRSLQPFFDACQRGDAALSRVAERFARRQSEGSAALDVSEMSFALRAEGSPYVWPRAWTLEGGDLSAPAAVERMRAWLQGFGDGGERRCGIAMVSQGERSVLAAVAIDALADLEPLPVRSRVGGWVDVNARVLVPTTEAKVIVLGPSGAPYAVPTSFDGQMARARFRADRPGAFLVQLLASVAGGPRPVLEATVYADVPPPSSYFGDAAPGEPAASSTPDPDPAASLLRMVNEARASEQSSALARDSALDQIALHHAEAMRRLKRIAHDAGDGDPKSRVEAANIGVLAAGENVAHALDVTRAHRALWASPSHRENLLEPRYDRIGIGTVVDADGSIWVCEVFADFPDSPR